MASRRKKRKQAAEDVDPLGGFSLDELLGLDLIGEVEQKQSVIGKVLGLPFRLVAGLIKAPLKVIGGVVKLPLRLVRAILPSRNKGE